MNSFETHQRFLAALASGNIPDDLAQYYVNAYRESVESGQHLDICLGIRGPGVRLPATRELYERRDGLLLALACNIEGPSLWRKCEIISQAIRRWPRSRHEAPALLADVLLLPVQVPKSAGGIYAAITKTAHSKNYLSID